VRQNNITSLHPGFLIKVTPKTSTSSAVGNQLIINHQDANATVVDDSF